MLGQLGEGRLIKQPVGFCFCWLGARSSHGDVKILREGEEEEHSQPADAFKKGSGWPPSWREDVNHSLHVALVPAVALILTASSTRRIRAPTAAREEIVSQLSPGAVGSDLLLLVPCLFLPLLGEE